MKFGQYELLERIAVGGMAEVYLGRVAGAEGFEKLVAIKRILPEYAKDERFISMLLSEARIHSALSHRNIVQIHDLGISEEGEYFIVLEYVEGHDLRAVMEAASALGVQIPDLLALHIVDELAQALHFAHELKDADGHPLGIVHRDVSPSNVLLSNSGEVKLSDFGLAKRQHDHSVVGALKGSLVYMSPEQAKKETTDRRTDVFSLGAVLFEMVTGQKLREITNELDGWREVSSGAIRSARALRPDLPDAFEALLKRALAPDPNDRFPDAAAFGAAIRELGRENDSPAGPNDIKELIEVLDPPRHARSPVERSKVIRLGPEFKLPAAPPAAARPGLSLDALAAMAAAAEAARVPAALKPPRKERTQIGVGPRIAGGVNVSGDAGDLATPLPATMVLKTPPLVTPPPPNAAPLLAPPAIVMAPTPATTSIVPPTIKAANGGGKPGANAGAKAGAKNGHSNGTSGHAAPAGSDAGEPTPPPTPPPAPKATATPFEPLAVFPDLPVDPDESMATPPPAAPGSSYGSGRVAAPVSADRLSAPFSGGVAQGQLSAPFSSSATIVDAPKSSKAGWLLAVIALLGGAAAYVHLRVIPLQLLTVWSKPASLQVTTDPEGAEVKLDGRTVGGPTPAKLDVTRDRTDHMIEVSKEGFKPTWKTVRFDQTAELSASLTLTALPAPPPPPKEEAKEAAKEAAKEEPKVEAKAEEKTGEKEDGEAKTNDKPTAEKADAKAGDKTKTKEEAKAAAPEEKKTGKAAHKAKTKKKKGKKAK